MRIIEKGIVWTLFFILLSQCVFIRIFASFLLHPILALVFVHTFDGVAEGGAGHGGGVFGKEGAEDVHAAALAHLAEEPTDGLVHEVVRVVEMVLGVAEGVGSVVGLQRCHRRDDGDALLPEVIAVSEAVHEMKLILFRGVRLYEPRAENLVAAEVHEVPVVGAAGIGEVEFEDLLLGLGSSTFAVVLIDEDEETAEPHFVPFVAQQHLHLLQREVVVRLDESARFGNFQS